VLLRERYRFHVRAMEEYLPGRHDGPITLILAADRVRGGPAGGWDRYAASVDVRVLPGEHHTILEANVAATAGEMNEWLRRMSRPAEGRTVKLT
jgi:thioesterase domain-containing protein